jgi:hypothetical protein
MAYGWPQTVSHVSQYPNLMAGFSCESNVQYHNLWETDQKVCVDHLCDPVFLPVACLGPSKEMKTSLYASRVSPFAIPWE